MPMHMIKALSHTSTQTMNTIPKGIFCRVCQVFTDPWRSLNPCQRVHVVKTTFIILQNNLLFSHSVCYNCTAEVCQSQQSIWPSTYWMKKNDFRYPELNHSLIYKTNVTLRTKLSFSLAHLSGFLLHTYKHTSTQFLLK